MYQLLDTVDSSSQLHFLDEKSVSGSVITKGILGWDLSAFYAVSAAAINFEPVTAQLETMSRGGGGQDILDVAPRQVLRGPA